MKAYNGQAYENVRVNNNPKLGHIRMATGFS
jgi:hypothetical protein